MTETDWENHPLRTETDQIGKLVYYKNEDITLPQINGYSPSTTMASRKAEPSPLEKEVRRIFKKRQNDNLVGYQSSYYQKNKESISTRKKQKRDSAIQSADSSI